MPNMLRLSPENSLLNAQALDYHSVYQDFSSLDQPLTITPHIGPSSVRLAPDYLCISGPSHIMAQSADVPRRASRPLPTLEDSYASLMANLAHIVRLIGQHMAVGHLLETPWEEARTLRNMTSHDEFIFDVLWRSEPDPRRFEDLREWVAVVKIKPLICSCGSGRGNVKAMDRTTQSPAIHC